MRNRGAHTVRGLAAGAARAAAVLALLPAALLLVAAGVASAEAAATDGVAAERLSSSLVGPVGIVAVILGLGGLAVGLLRRRRTMAARAAATTMPMPVTTEPTRTGTAA